MNYKFFIKTILIMALLSNSCILNAMERELKTSAEKQLQPETRPEPVPATQTPPRPTRQAPLPPTKSEQQRLDTLKKSLQGLPSPLDVRKKAASKAAAEEAQAKYLQKTGILVPTLVVPPKVTPAARPGELPQGTSLSSLPEPKPLKPPTSGKSLEPKPVAEPKPESQPSPKPGEKTTEPTVAPTSLAPRGVKPAVTVVNVAREPVQTPETFKTVQAAKDFLKKTSSDLTPMNPNELKPGEAKQVIDIGNKLLDVSDAVYKNLTPEEKIQMLNLIKTRTFQLQMGDNIAAGIGESRQGITRAIAKFSDSERAKGTSEENLQKLISKTFGSQLEKLDSDLKALETTYGFIPGEVQKSRLVKSNDIITKLGTEKDLRIAIMKEAKNQIDSFSGKKNLTKPEKQLLKETINKYISNYLNLPVADVPLSQKTQLDVEFSQFAKQNPKEVKAFLATKKKGKQSLLKEIKALEIQSKKISKSSETLKAIKKSSDLTAEAMKIQESIDKNTVTSKDDIGKAQKRRKALLDESAKILENLKKATASQEEKLRILKIEQPALEKQIESIQIALKPKKSL